MIGELLATLDYDLYKEIFTDAYNSNEAERADRIRTLLKVVRKYV
jgi:hypothetical protein